MNESLHTFSKLTNAPFESVIEKLIVTDVKKKNKWKSKLAQAHFSSMPNCPTSFSWFPVTSLGPRDVSP